MSSVEGGPASSEPAGSPPESSPEPSPGPPEPTPTAPPAGVSREEWEEFRVRTDSRLEAWEVTLSEIKRTLAKPADPPPPPKVEPPPKVPTTDAPKRYGSRKWFGER